MKTLLIYATNSSGTFQAAELIRDVLQSQHHVVEMQSARETTPEQLAGHDLIILGSCTWERMEQGHRLEGQLQQHMHALAGQLHDHPIPGQAFAVFGLGDQSYTDFCQAADRLEDLVHDMQGHLVTPTLRIDRWFFHLEQNRARARSWAEQVITGAHQPRSPG